MGINHSKNTYIKIDDKEEKITLCRRCDGRGYTVYYVPGYWFTGSCIPEPCFACGNRGVVS